MKLDELERLNQARTPGQWLSYSDEGPIRYPAPDREGWTHSICIGNEEPHTCIGTVLAKDEPQARADSDAIAAAVNALGPLLKLARAVEAYIEINKTPLDCENEFVAMCEAFDEVLP